VSGHSPCRASGHVLAESDPPRPLPAPHYHGAKDRCGRTIFRSPAEIGGAFFVDESQIMVSIRSTDARAGKHSAASGPSEAMREFVRALARAAAIEDYRRQNSGPAGDEGQK
jgi:hypothetical protein